MNRSSADRDKGSWVQWNALALCPNLGADLFGALPLLNSGLDRCGPESQGQAFALSPAMAVGRSR
jgi:hypothetical protein